MRLDQRIEHRLVALGIVAAELAGREGAVEGGRSPQRLERADHAMHARILELRMETELALGAKFDRLAYNNFLLQQGMLPPDLLAKAVREQFVPSRRVAH